MLPGASNAREEMPTFPVSRFKGEGNASHVLGIQLPLIAQQFPAVADCHAGTINVTFEHPLIVVTPDFRTTPIDWKPGKHEVFDFVRVTLQVPYEGPACPAWLYVAYRSAHRRNLAAHEIIAPKLNLDGIERLGVVISRKCTQIAYRANPIALIV